MSKGSSSTTKSNICIVESLEFMEEDSYREGEVISRTLKMSGKRPHYAYVRSRAELAEFVKEFGRSNNRYLHISCHGSKKAFWTTLDRIPTSEMVDLLAPHVKDRRVFVSACLAANSNFATALMTRGECFSVVGPVGTPHFDDAAIFWVSFYHLMFKKSWTSMSNTDIESNLKLCARLVGERFRFFFWRSDKLVERLI